MKRIFLYLCAVILIVTTTQAQTDSTQTNQVHFKISFNYNSALNYYGRTDSLHSSGVFPLAELWFASHFYINAAPVFINNKSVSFDYAGTVTTIGYQHTSDKWISNIYITKPFYKQNVQLVQAALQAQTGISFSYLNKVLNLTAGADAKFSNKTDFGATAGVDHIIRIQNKDNSVLVLDPAFYAYAGTQQFTNTYYQKRAGFLFLPGSNEQVNQNVNAFNILAYEVSVPVIYAKRKMQILLTPAYIMPQNLIAVPNRPDISEQGKDMFYVTAGVKYIF